MQTDAEQPVSRAWRDLYLAALFEADSAKLPERIAKAEYALALRERELCGGDHSGEKQALTGAMQLLKRCGIYISTLAERLCRATPKTEGAPA